MKDKWSNYAFKNGKVKSCYQREYCNRKKIRKAGAPGNCDSNVQSREVQPETQKEIGPNEDVREENPSEAHQERRQGIQIPDQRRRKVKETDHETEAGEEEVKEKEKMTPKEKKHEARESKAFEKKEDRKEAKKESPKKKK